MHGLGIGSAGTPYWSAIASAAVDVSSNGRRSMCAGLLGGTWNSNSCGIHIFILVRMRKKEGKRIVTDE
jgi:hypothetical protein